MPNSDSERAIESVPIKWIDLREMQGLSPGTRKTDGLFHTIETNYPSETDNPLSKLMEKQMDKVRWIVHPKLRPFHFQIKMYYLSDTNPTDNLPKMDNPSLL